MHDKSFAAAIVLSFASPMFRELGPDTRMLLEAVAFPPQGVNENNLVSGMIDILDESRVLPMTYRSNSFVKNARVTSRPPPPQGPQSSALLCMIKERHFDWMPVDLYPVT